MHTRFEHSLGVMHVANSMFESVVKTSKEVLIDEMQFNEAALERERMLVRLAALLHDVIDSIESIPASIATLHWSDSPLHLVEPHDDNTEIERIRTKLETVLASTGGGSETPLGDLVGGELTDVLKGDGDLNYMRSAEAKYDQYRRSLRVELELLDRDSEIPF